jgi:glycosyltransferase involved in cell wall biosynthesis
MHIAMVTSWPPRPCGIATYSLSLVWSLRDLGHRVSVVCHTDGGSPGEGDVYPVLRMSEPDAFEQLYGTVERLDPDVVHVQHEFGLYTQPKPDGSLDYSGLYAFGLAVPLFRWRALGRPVVVTFHSDYAEGDRIRLLYLDLVLRMIPLGIMHHRRLISQTRALLGRPVGNLRAVPHGAPVEKGQPRKTELGLAGRPVAGMIGWFDRYKGFDRVVRVWHHVVERIPEAVLIVAAAVRPGTPGGEEIAAEVERLIADSPAAKNIVYLRRIFEPSEFLDLVATFDVLVLPYTSAAASGPLSQAAAAGVPVVVTPVGGLRAYVEDSGAGLIASDDAELVQAIVRLLADSGMRVEMSRRARRFALKTSWPRVARRHVQLYSTVRRMVE